MCLKSQGQGHLTMGSWELFSDISESVSTCILSRGHLRNFPSGEVLFSFGDTAKEVFLLTQGRVKITQVTKEGEEVVLRLDSPGGIIGSPCMGRQAMHNSTAQAIEESKTFFWDAHTFAAALNQFPVLERNVQRILEQRIHEIERRVCDLETARASPRLARQLVSLLKQIGKKRNGEIEIEVTHELLAGMASMTESTVSRFLCEWQAQGVVRVRRGLVTIRSYSALKCLSQESRGSAA